MDITDPKIVKLKTLVEAARDEFDMAIVFREVWRPAAIDVDLHSRVSHSYAGHAFLTCRMALRREMLLSLYKLWDSHRQAIGMTKIAETLEDKAVIEALAVDRVQRLDLPESMDAMRKDLQSEADDICTVIATYRKGGNRYPVLKHLTSLRHERLAHRQPVPGAVTAGPEPVDADIETFVDDNAKLIQALMSLVLATAYDPRETARVYKRYATEFWTGVRGETTNGHPNYRRPRG